MEPVNLLFNKFILLKKEISSHNQPNAAYALKKDASKINRCFAYNFRYNNEDIEAFKDFISRKSLGNLNDTIWEGGAGFFVAMHYIEQNFNAVEISNLLQMQSVKLYLEQIYEIDVKWDLKYYKLGTTSYIFKGSSNNVDRIFKIIKPRYTINEKITHQTRSYIDSQPNLDFTPDIYKANDFCIQMEYISGKTLREINIQFAKLENDFKVNKREYSHFLFFRFFIISHIIRELNELLAELYNLPNRMCHGDLNPGNIIIKNIQEIDKSLILKNEPRKITDNIKIKLIDFGKNYLLNDDFGATSAVASVMVYASKEIIEGETYSYKADIYSLGILMLELWNNQEKFEEKKLDTYRHTLRETNPILASLINEMLIEEPNIRLNEAFYCRPEIYGIYQNNPYVYLKDILDTEFDITITQLEPQSNSALIKVLNATFKIITNDYAGVFGLLIGNKKIITEAFNRNTDSLYRTKLDQNYFRAIISNFASLTVIFFFFYFIFNYYSDEELWWTYFPGIFICSLFAPLAHTYYMNIFSQISTKNLGKLGVFVEIWLWLCTFYYAPIIIFFSYSFPNKWPLATFIGTLIIAFNNTLHYYLARRSLKALCDRMKQEVPTNQEQVSEQSINRFFNKKGIIVLDLKDDSLKKELKDFSVWQLMYPFSIPMLLLFVFLNSANAPDWMRLESGYRLYDELAYAIIIFLVILKLYFDNNNYQGPKLSNFLQYCYCEYRKAIYLAKSSEKHHI